MKVKKGHRKKNNSRRDRGSRLKRQFLNKILSGSGGNQRHANWKI